MSVSPTPAPVVSSNVIHMTDWMQRAPLVPVESDLRGLPAMMLDALRLTRSGLATHASGDEFRAAVLLWCESWLQTPAASLPDDDRELARLVGLSTTRWRRLRQGAMRGWVKCSNGRFYHPVVAEKANEAWEMRSKQRANANKRWHPEPRDGETEGEHQEISGKNRTKSAKSSSKKATETSNINDIENATAMPCKGKVREEKKETETTDVVSGGPAAPPAPSLPLDLPKTAKRGYDPTDPIARARHQLWTEGREIVERIDPSLDLDTVRGLLTGLVAACGGQKAGGLPRALHRLRDIEVAWIAGEISDHIKPYIRKIIHVLNGTDREDKLRTEAAARAAKGETAAMMLARMKREAQAAADAEDAPVAPLPPSRGPTIDHEPDDVFSAWLKDQPAKA